MHDFQIKANKMSYLSSIYYLSNVLFLFVAGFVLDKCSTKKTIIIAMLVCVLSTFVLAHAHTFFIALLCRFFTGIGSAFCFLGPIRLASRWFPPRRMALVTGIIVTMAMIGGMLAQYPLTRLVAYVGWREALMQIGYMGVVILFIMYFGIIDKASEPCPKTFKKTSFKTVVKEVYLDFKTIKAALYASLMNMSIAVFGAMMGTLYLMQRLGINKESSALINSFLFIGAIVGGPVIGWFSDKMGLRLWPMKIGAIASFLLLLLILYCPVSLMGMKILFFLLGFFTAAQIISYAFVAESSAISMTASAVSVVSILVQAGYILYQNIFTILLTQHGDMQMSQGTPMYSLADYQHAALILPFGIILAFVSLMGLKETYGRHLE